MHDKGNFTKVPFRLFDQLSQNQMDVRDVMVYFAITKNKDGFQLSLRRLSRMTGIPRPSVGESIDRLVKNKYIHVRSQTVMDAVVVKGKEVNLPNTYMFFRNLVDFDLEAFRMYSNWTLHLATSREDFEKIYSGSDVSHISPTDVAVLMYLKRRKFENASIQGKDYYSVNFAQDSAIIGLTRATFANCFWKLVDLRFVIHSRLTGKISIRNHAIKEYFRRKKEHVLSKCPTEEVVLEKFTVIDKLNLESMISEAKNVVSVQAVKQYVMELSLADKITDAEEFAFHRQADERDAYLRAHYEETADETYSKEDFYPIKVISEVSMERALGHYS